MKITREHLTAIVREALRLQSEGLFIDSVRYFWNQVGCSLLEAKRAADILARWRRTN